MNKTTARNILRESALHPLDEVTKARKTLGIKEIRSGTNPRASTIKKNPGIVMRKS